MQSSDIQKAQYQILQTLTETPSSATTPEMQSEIEKVNNALRVSKPELSGLLKVSTPDYPPNYLEQEYLFGNQTYKPNPWMNINVNTIRDEKEIINKNEGNRLPPYSSTRDDYKYSNYWTGQFTQADKQRASNTLLELLDIKKKIYNDEIPNDFEEDMPKINSLLRDRPKPKPQVSEKPTIVEPEIDPATGRIKRRFDLE